MITSGMLDKMQELCEKDQSLLANPTHGLELIRLARLGLECKNCVCYSGREFEKLQEIEIELLKRWDNLGTNKDDDFGDVQEIMQQLRAALTRAKEKE